VGAAGDTGAGRAATLSAVTRAGLLLLALLALLAAPAGAADRRVPQGWLGVVADGPLRAEHGTEWDGMVTAGAESVRTAVRWHELQPSAGAPDLGPLDAVVAAAASRGLAVLPVVTGTPGWAAETPGDVTSPPVDPATYGRFLAGLVARYGPAGSLWAERPHLPRIPIRAWQIWNEPNLTRYWSEQPFARSYVRLLRAARTALRGADPAATVVLAGLPNESWTALRRIYRAGGRGWFDAVALHPYTRRPRDVVRTVRYARREMRKRRDGRLPVWVTELSWPAAKGKVDRPVGFEVSDKGQAVRLDAALERLAAARKRQRIARVFWYTWLSSEAGPSAFDWSGLRRARAGGVVDAPALAAFRRQARRLEGCAKAPGDARRCA
jgi:hypothetical protein